ncbi:cytochrome P450 [Streptomyces uncialis]|uniref:cytochrome P450 n=1 Tax=Streptomyces uncialis TaxID=1048205 RepID=UPI00386A0C40|nr:cytochrome P450 [Streptomyces uncialis]
MTEQTVPRPPVPTGASQAEMLERYEDDRLGHLLSSARRFGPVCELTEGTVLVSDPALVHDVLKRTNTDFLVTSNIRRDEVSGERGDPGTEAWMRGRRATQKGMGPAALAAHREWLTEETGRLIAGWRTRSSVTDPVAELERLSARSFTRFCFGTRDPGSAARRTGELLAALTPIISSPFHFPRAIRRFMPRYRRSVDAQRTLERELRRALDAPGGGGLVESLADAGLDPEASVRMLVSNGLASYRVPAAAVTWTLVALARNPAVADELAGRLGGAGTGDGAGDADGDPLLAWTIAESLRLWPPNWLILRTANGEQSCGGWRLPPGASVIVSPYVVHRTAPSFAGDPDTFRPERWSGMNPGPGEYLPYGIGSRWCVGKALADLELTTIVAALAREFRFSVRTMAERPDVRTTLLPASLTLGLRPR